MRVLVIDNYDSFTYNLVQYLGELGAEVEVIRNDKAEVAELLERGPDRLVGADGHDAGRVKPTVMGEDEVRGDAGGPRAHREMVTMPLDQRIARRGARHARDRKNPDHRGGAAPAAKERVRATHHRGATSDGR